LNGYYWIDVGAIGWQNHTTINNPWHGNAFYSLSNALNPNGCPHTTIFDILWASIHSIIVLGREWPLLGLWGWTIARISFYGGGGDCSSWGE